MKYTFAKGVHPESFKELSRHVPIGEMPVGERVYINVAQHIGAAASPVVKRGDAVKVGTLIAAETGNVSSNIYSSVSGLVSGTVDRVTADGTAKPHIVIENDGKDTAVMLPQLKNPSAEEIIERIRLAGIVGLGGAGFPTAVKLKPRAAVDTLIINAAECEPYITCDYRILMEYTEQFIGGVQYLQRALNHVKCVIGIECDKREAIEHLTNYLAVNRIDHISVAPCRVKYPQGAEKQLIYALTRRKVPARGGLPADVGVIVQNVHTALSVYFAVSEGQPLFRRIVTVTGNGCKSPKNLWVRNGTTVAEIVKFCGVNVTADELESKRSLLEKAKEDFRSNPKDKTAKLAYRHARTEAIAAENGIVAKLISGGPMMGVTLYTDEVAAVKTTSCILMMTKGELCTVETSPCINCSKCVVVCPMKLQPNLIEQYGRVSDWDAARKYGATECILCGCCSYICPAKRPLLQKISQAKQTISELDRAAAKKQADSAASAKEGGKK